MHSSVSDLQQGTYREHRSFHLIDFFLRGFHPALWPEAIDVLSKYFLVAVQDPCIHTDDRAPRHKIAVDRGAFGWNNALEHKPSVGMHSKRLIYSGLATYPEIINMTG